MKKELILLTSLLGAGAFAQFNQNPPARGLFEPPPPTNFGRTNIFTSTNNSAFFPQNRFGGRTGMVGGAVSPVPGITNAPPGLPGQQGAFTPYNPNAGAPGTVPPGVGVPREIPTLPGTQPTAPGVPPQVPVTPPGLPGTVPALPGNQPGLQQNPPGLPGNQPGLGEQPALPGGAPPPGSFTVPGGVQPIQPVQPAQPVQPVRPVVPPKAPLR